MLTKNFFLVGRKVLGGGDFGEDSMAWSGSPAWLATRSPALLEEQTPASCALAWLAMSSMALGSSRSEMGVDVGSSGVSYDDD